MKSTFIISFSDSLVTLRSLNASRFLTNVSIPRTFLEKRGGGAIAPLAPPGYATGVCAKSGDVFGLDYLLCSVLWTKIRCSKMYNIGREINNAYSYKSLATAVMLQARPSSS